MTASAHAAHIAYIGVGANLGDAVGQVRHAIDALGTLGPARASSLYRTEPLGDPEQPWYINAVVELVTEETPDALLEQLHALEAAGGRERHDPDDPAGSGRSRWQPRTLDLDLLLYSDRVIDSPLLRLPHPGLSERRFVLEPLAELAPQAREPRSGRTVGEILAGLEDPLRVEKLPGYTNSD